MRSASSSLVLSGKGTKDGTASFIKHSGLSLHHCLEKAQLFINPIIHGPPQQGSMSQEESEVCFAKALLRNRSNCLYIYNHYDCKEGQEDEEGDRWAIGESSLQEILEAGGVKRASLVTVAGLGRTTSRAQISRRLREASALTGIEEIDLAVVDFDDDSFSRNPNCVDEALEELEGLCKLGLLQSYGLRIDVAPYRYHTPSPRLSSSLAMIPPIIEEALGSPEGAAHGDVIMYTISPTTALPATYPMLDPEDLDVEALEEKMRESEKLEQEKKGGDDDADDKDDDEEEEDDDDGEIVSTTHREGARRFTRVAWRPLVCSRGYGRGDDEEDEEASLQAAVASTPHLAEDAEAPAEPKEQPAEEVPLVSALLPPRLEQELGDALDTLCPELSSTPLLQIKALRAVMSVGIDAVVLDAELSCFLDKLELRPQDMLPASATDDLFGVFCLPPGLLKSKRKA